MHVDGDCHRRRLPHTTPHRLLMAWEELARKHGVPQHRVVTWVRRKLGPDLSLVRWTTQGVGCAAPCVFCTRALIKYDLRVHCPLSDGGWYSGRMDEPCAPTPLLTSGQRRSMGLEPTPAVPTASSAPSGRKKHPQHGSRRTSPERSRQMGVAV